jgi:hypothetical protein
MPLHARNRPLSFVNFGALAGNEYMSYEVISQDLQILGPHPCECAREARKIRALLFTCSLLPQSFP